ncbi:MAG: hypothetical protein IT305_00935 [Chloroflexi bacterium]|nr:hypothetical protein [Chloroflexota bacterium]
MNNLRSWVNIYEEAVGVDPQGIVSFLYDPTPAGSPAPGPAIVTQSWINDILDIGDNLPHQDTLLVRTNIRANQHTNALSQYYCKFHDALSLYSQNNIDVVAVFTNEFDLWDKIDDEHPYDFHPNHNLEENNGRANKYITHYAAKAAEFASAMSDTGLKSFWIWNEPDLHGIIPVGQYNPSAGDLAPEVFGAMLYQTSMAIRSVIPDATIYAGSFAMQHQRNFAPLIQRVNDFLNRMYLYLNNTSIFPPPGQYGFGWDALGVNVEGVFDEVYSQAVFDTITFRQMFYGDRPNVVVGEWGTQNENLEQHLPSEIREMYLALRFYFPIMYFFSHHWVPEDGTYGTMNFTNSNPPCNIDTSTHTYQVGIPKPWRIELRGNLYPIQ